MVMQTGYFASVKRFCHKAKQTLCGQSVIAVGKKHLRSTPMSGPVS
jgi:hypothetical protein